MQINKACTTRGTRKRNLVKVSWSWKSQGGLQAHLGLQNTSQLCGKRKILNRAFGLIYFILIWRVALFYLFFLFFRQENYTCNWATFYTKTFLSFSLFCRYLIYAHSVLGSWMACVFSSKHVLYLLWHCVCVRCEWCFL